MPWITENGNQYELCLIDTNIISEIVKNKSGETKGFLEKYAASSNVICITVYSLIELRRNTKVYETFIDVFSILPFLILKPFFQIFQDERDLYKSENRLQPILISITPLNEDPRLHLRNLLDELFSNNEIIESENAWRSREISVLQNWMSQTNNFETTSDVANSRDADRYVEEAGLQTLIRLDIDWSRKIIQAHGLIDTTAFPSVIGMLYSQYYRLYDPHWKAEPQEITDISIMGVAPYVDVVITEKFQAEILKKIRTKVRGMDKLEIATLRDIRR